MADEPKQVVANFKKSKDTKSAAQFKEEGSDFMGSIYMKHDQLAKLGNPTELVVVVTPKS